MWRFGRSPARLTRPRALVIRDCHSQRIAGRHVVRGDLLKLNDGDRVGADALPVEADGLQADESLLTGAPEGRTQVVAAKGAPEAVIDLCHLDAPLWLALLQGLGVLAVVLGVYAELAACPAGGLVLCSRLVRTSLDIGQPPPGRRRLYLIQESHRVPPCLLQP